MHAAAPRAVLFDVFGTLLDVYSVQAAAEARFPSYGARIATLWRDKQIEYTRLRTLSRRYAPFIDVTRDALRFTLAALALPVEDRDVAALLAEYDRLRCFPEVAAVLARLRERGLVLGVLSNGDLALLARALGHADVLPYLTHVLSADAVKQFKTADAVYALGPAALNLPSAQTLFVSSNGWDAIGATWYGYTTLWINRSNAPLEELGTKPNAVGRDLNAIDNFF
jgi:2-haloacid dehalogenase